LAKKNEIKNPTSDNQLSIFTQANEINDLISLDNLYNRVIDDIKSNIDDIFNNYIKIGFLLNEAINNKLYELDDFDNIYDFADYHFKLSKTTVKNVTSIATRFCDKEGRLLIQYKDHSYSALVEMIPMTDSEIESIEPEATVKEIRQQKSFNKINKKLSEYFSKENNYFKELVDTIIGFNYDYHLKLDSKVDISYIIPKPDYTYEELSIDIKFTLQHVFFKNDINFNLSIERRSWEKDLSFSIYHSQISYFTKRFESISGLESALKKFCKDISSNYYHGKYFVEKIDDSISTDDKLSQDEGPGHDLFDSSRVERYNYPGYRSYQSYLLFQFLLKHFEGLYCEIQESSVEFFKKHKRHKNKNPLLFKIVAIDSLLHTKVIIPGDDVDTEHLLFSGLEEFMNTKLEVYFGKNKDNPDQTTIFDFINISDEGEKNV
jgi:hypothetical protein